MSRITVRKIQYGLGALLLSGLAAALLFIPAKVTPVRAMVERSASTESAQHSTVSPADAVNQSSAGVISIQVVTGIDGPPPPAARLYGKLSGSTKGSTTITAVGANNATCGTGAVSSSSYSLDITGTDAACSTAGSTVHFLVNGKTAAGSATIPPVSAAVHADLTP
jgi:hypothetical protein